MAGREPRLHLHPGVVVQRDDRPPPVGRVLAALEQPMLLQVARQLARSGQREPELARDVADRALTLVADVGEHGHVAPAERRLAVHEREQLGRRAPPVPEAPHDAAEARAELRQLCIFGYHTITIIPSEPERR